jgi:hypothetical protein
MEGNQNPESRCDLVNHVTLAETSKEARYISIPPITNHCKLLYYTMQVIVQCVNQENGQEKHLHERKARRRRRNTYIQVDGPLSVCVVGIITKTKTKTKGEKRGKVDRIRALHTIITTKDPRTKRKAYQCHPHRLCVA